MIDFLKFINNYYELLIILWILIFYLIIDYYFRRKLNFLEKELYKRYEVDILENRKLKVVNIENIKEEDKVYFYKNKNILYLMRYLFIFI